MDKTAKWIVPIMGFRESTMRVTGLEKLWKGIRTLSTSTVTVVTPFEWRDNLAGFANYILRNSMGLPAETMVIAYSWGCGEGFLRFAREAEGRGLPIRMAVLCDPVYRSRWLPTWLPLNPLSISPILRPKISIPASVERVEWVRQRMDIPQGHDLIAEDKEVTKISPARYIQRGHTSIDDSREFQELAVNWATLFAHDQMPHETQSTWGAE